MSVLNFVAAAFPIERGAVMIGAGAVNYAGSASACDSYARWGYPPGLMGCWAGPKSRQVRSC